MTRFAGWIIGDDVEQQIFGTADELVRLDLIAVDATPTMTAIRV